MDLWVPVVVAILAWWFSTGAILYLDGLPRPTFAWTMIGATFVLALALIGIAQGADTATPSGAYFAFACGLACWGWQEITLYLGYITGPRRQGLAEGARGWNRFAMAVRAILYHEVAIALLGLLLLWVTLGGANQVALGTYLILWIMRLSAKINIYLGVPNHSAEFLPRHIAYLASYFRKQSMNLFFPLSVTASTLVTGWLFLQASAAPSGSFEQVSWALLAALLALAVLEHWFLVVPLPVTKLWSWGMSERHAKPGRPEPRDSDVHSATAASTANAPMMLGPTK